MSDFTKGLIVAIVVIAGILGLSATLAACSDATGDAPVSNTNQAGAEQFQMPDGFSNFAAKCDGPNMVYVVYHGGAAYGSIAVAPNDPRCVDQ